MVLCANACGKDIIEFVLEAKNEIENTKATENQPFEVVKSELYLRKQKFVKAKGDSYLRKSVAFTKNYGCAFCDFTTHSPNALSGHMNRTVARRHSSKYQSLNMTV